MNELVKKLLSTKEPDGLDSFDRAVRGNALEKYMTLCSADLAADSPTKHNMHCHTFYSYNCFGWSPTHVALAAKLLGFRTCGMVDFDVLYGVDEFIAACKRLNIRPLCGMETRVYIPELKDDVINSPGEPGIAYHMGIGFCSSVVPEEARAFAKTLAERSQARTRKVTQAVNAAIPEVALDFDREVLPLTPAGNPTERHVCYAYRMKALSVFGSVEKAMEYWKKVLKLDDAKAAKAAASEAVLEGAIRSALMKSGGPGYIKPDASMFPTLDEMNAFSRACGAIPCVAWLNGFSSGEADPEKLLAFHVSKGCEALTIIPDRNWNIADPEKKQKSIANMDAFIKAARKAGLPIVAGTELNTPGQKLVDDFDHEPLSFYLDDFLLSAERLCKRFS